MTAVEKTAPSQTEAISFELDLRHAVRVRSVRVRITATDPYWLPWTMAEIRAYTPRR